MSEDPSSLGTARKDNRTSRKTVRGIVIALFIAAGLILFLGTASPSRAEEVTVQPKAVAPNVVLLAVNSKANEYRERADFYGHKLGIHVRFSHKTLHPSGSIAYEIKRRNAWFRTARKYETQYKQRLGHLAGCRRAGFPRWYCPILVKAAEEKGVAHWARSTDLAFIIRRESGFRPLADNPTSTAYGLFQMLTERSSDPHRQTLNGLRYIQGRYGSPAAAVAFWQRNHWY